MPSPKGRILCTEDDPDSRELIVFILEGGDYDVTVTEDSAEALALAQRDRFDLILVDNWMPGLSGPELARHIREFDQTTPILFYSAAAYESDKQAALSAGAQSYLVKPADIDELLGEVDRLLSTGRQF